jgi:hypothetical protein
MQGQREDAIMRKTAVLVVGVVGTLGVAVAAASPLGGAYTEGAVAVADPAPISAKDRADAGRAHRTLQAERQAIASHVLAPSKASPPKWDAPLMRRKAQSLATQAKVVQRIAAKAKSARHGTLAARILTEAVALQQQFDAVAATGGKPASRQQSAVASSLEVIDTAAREMAIIEPDILR